MKTLVTQMTLGALALTAIATSLSGCAPISMKHEVAPIYATVDINIRIQQELEEFFDFEQTRSERAGPASGNR